MKYLLLSLVISLSSIFLTSCDDEPNISGKPASKWIADLDDLNPDTRFKAVHQLSFADDKTFSKASARLEELAKDGDYNAAYSLFLKQGKVFFECADLYAYQLPSNKTGMDALKKLSYSNSSTVQETLQKAIEAASDSDAAAIKEFSYELFPETRPTMQLNLEALKKFNLEEKSAR